MGIRPKTEMDQKASLYRKALSELNLKRIQAIKQGQSRVDLPEELLAECHLLDANKIGHRNVLVTDKHPVFNSVCACVFYLFSYFVVPPCFASLCYRWLFMFISVYTIVPFGGHPCPAGVI